MLNFLKRYFCKHNWELLVKESHESPLIRLKKSGFYKVKGLYEDAAFGTSIIILKCDKCGSIDKTVTKI